MKLSRSRPRCLFRSYLYLFAISQALLYYLYPCPDGDVTQLGDKSGGKSTFSLAIFAPSPLPGSDPEPTSSLSFVGPITTLSDCKGINASSIGFPYPPPPPPPSLPPSFYLTSYKGDDQRPSIDKFARAANLAAEAERTNGKTR